MDNVLKKVGMVHLPGINDKAYNEYLSTLKPSEPIKVNPNCNQW